MLKKLSIVTVLVFSTMALSAAELKVGVVNIQSILSKAPQVKSLNEKIQQQFKERYDALGALQKKSSVIQENAQRDELTLTIEQKMDIKHQLQEIDAEFKLKQTFMQEDINLFKNQEQSKLIRLVKQAMNKLANDEKFDLILDSEAVHAGSVIDVSDKIIAIISKP